MNTKPETKESVIPILDAAHTAAEELKFLRDRLSFDTRHSFRTPLTVIDGTARRLARRAETMSPDEVRERVHTIRATVEKMVGIVERSIEMSELASCVQDRPPATSELSEVTASLIEEYKGANPHLNFVSWSEESEPLQVTDRRLVELVLDKLFTIGADIVKNHGRLDFLTWSDGHDVSLSLKAVFEARSLVDVSELSNVLAEEDKARLNMLCQGTELKIIRLLIEQYGGELDVDMDNDRVEFEIHLPIETLSETSGPALIRPLPEQNKEN